MTQKFYLLSLLYSLLFLAACDDGSKGDVDYVALGASDVVGVGATPLTNGYVYLVKDGLENASGKSINLDNLGIPGGEIEEIDNIEVEISDFRDPDLITLSVGANDIVDGDPVDGFESELNGLLGKLRSDSPDAIIAVSNIPDLTKLPRFIEEPSPSVTTEIIQAYNAAIARQAGVAGALLVDLYSTPLDDSLVSDVDGFHPSDQGHKAIADRFLNVITPVFISETADVGTETRIID